MISATKSRRNRRGVISATKNSRNRRIVVEGFSATKNSRNRRVVDRFQTQRTGETGEIGENENDGRRIKSEV